MAALKETPYLVAFTLDFETGDLKCQTGACTQIAIHATRLDTFENIGSYVKYIYPYHKKEIAGAKVKKKVLKKKNDEPELFLMDYENKALEYSAITMDMLYDQGEKIEIVAQEVLDFMESMTPEKTSKSNKPFLIGQNTLFDVGFLQQMMEYAGLSKEFAKLVRGQVDFYGNFQPLVIDTIVMGQLSMCHLPNINSYKLEIMCENLGVELDDAHDANADVAATTNVVSVLTNRLRCVDGTPTGGALALSKAEKSRKHFKI